MTSSPSWVGIATAAIAGLSAISCAWIATHVRRVEKTVNGHTAKLERKIAELRRALDACTATSDEGRNNHMP